MMKSLAKKVGTMLFQKVKKEIKDKKELKRKRRTQENDIEKKL
jgi:hypothetical protein